jgi:hypothetical protein
MMNPEDLARRAVACSGWRWVLGALAVRVEPLAYCFERYDPATPVGRRYRVLEVGADFARCDGECFTLPSRSFAPDLEDAATVGCLLALVREAWGIPTLAAVYCEEAHPGQGSGWAVQSADNRIPIAGEHATEPAALVAALEAAPKRTPKETP